MDNNSIQKIVLNILQWNSQSLKPKLVSFGELLIQLKIHIALVNETWLDSEDSVILRNYNTYRRDRTDGYGGVAIIVHRSVKCSVHTLHCINTNIEAIHLRLYNCKYLENVVCVYCPSSVRTTLTNWEEFFALFPEKTLIGGDFNGHHSNWSYKTDVRGTQIADAALDNDYVPLNDGSVTRIKLVNGYLQKSSPDITFVSSDIACKFEWSVVNENLGSDHLMIKINSSLGYYQNNIIKKRNFKRINWPAYVGNLRDHFLEVQVASFNRSVQAMYDFFEEQINKAVDISVPYVKFCTNPEVKFKPREYWNEALSLAVAKRRLALSTFRRNPTPDNLDKLEKATDDARKSIRRAKNNSRQKFYNSIDESVTSPEMWRRMRWIKGIRRNKSVIPLEKQTEFLHTMTPDSVSKRCPNITSTNCLLESDFTLVELENCLKKKDTAPGVDNITYSMIYNLPGKAKNFLLEIFNLIYQSSHVPQQWRQITVLPILKSSSSTSSAEMKLRPISLISCVCKIFHLMILRRLEWYIEKNKILSHFTVGFRKAQSCTDALVRLVSYIQVAFSENVPTLACFLDIKGAYDNVEIDQVISIMDELKVGSRICKYLWGFLSERNLGIRSESGDIIISRSTNRGLAQGDPLSPILFNIATHQICKLAQENGVLLAQYADDFVVYFSNKDLDVCESRVQTLLNSIVSILDDLGLEVSTSKTNLCFFSRGQRKIVPSLKIYGERISSSECVKYLGLWLDRSLLWGRHINYISEKCSKFLSILKVLAGSDWGMHPKHMRRLYISIIRSRMDYASFLFDTSSGSNRSKLDKIQNQALRIIGGFIKSSPIHVMECELSLPPLYLRRLYLAFKYCLRTLSWSNGVTSDIICKLSDLSANGYWSSRKKPLLVETYNKTKETSVHSSEILEMFNLDTWVSGIDVKNTVVYNLDSVRKAKACYDTNHLKAEVVRELNEKYALWYKIFTDGSKNGENRGVAFFSREHSSCFKIKGDVCIMTLELIAIAEAITFAAGVSSTSIVIFCDSKSALQHLARCASAFRGLPIAFTVLQKIYAFLKSRRQIRLQWVPSHIGLMGNEEADRLAKMGTMSTRVLNISPFYSEVLSKFIVLVTSSWKLYFDERSRVKGIWYRTLQCEPHRVPWFETVKMKRSQIKLAFRIRSGHYPCGKFLYLMKIANSPNCSTCNTLEDIYHLLMECDRNRNERAALMSRFNLARIDVGVAQAAISNPASAVATAFYDLVIAAFQ